MKCISDKKGVGIIELMGALFLSGLVMATLSSLVYFVYKSNQKINNNNVNTTANVAVYQNFKTCINSFEPQKSTILADGSLLLEKTTTFVVDETNQGTSTPIPNDQVSKIIISLNEDGQINVARYSVNGYAANAPASLETFIISSGVIIENLEFELLASKTGSSTNINIKGNVINVDSATSNFNFVIPYYRYSSTI